MSTYESVTWLEEDKIIFIIWIYRWKTYYVLWNAPVLEFFFFWITSDRRNFDNRKEFQLFASLKLSTRTSLAMTCFISCFIWPATRNNVGPFRFLCLVRCSTSWLFGVMSMLMVSEIFSEIVRNCDEWFKRDVWLELEYYSYLVREILGKYTPVQWRK